MVTGAFFALTPSFLPYCPPGRFIGDPSRRNTYSRGPVHFSDSTESFGAFSTPFNNLRIRGCPRRAP